MFFLLKRLVFCLHLLFGSHIHEGSGNDFSSEILDLFGLELDEATGHCKKGIIFTTLHVLAWVELSTTLTDNDVSDRNGLVAKYLDTESLGNRITTVRGRSARFSGCHSSRGAYTLGKLRYTGFEYITPVSFVNVMWERATLWFRENGSRLLQLLGVLLVGILSFEAGLLQGRAEPRSPIVLSLPAIPVEGAPSSVLGAETPSALPSTHREPVVERGDNRTDCVFVGSKNSNKYHLPSCTVAKRIRPENRVCFASKEEAEKRGYSPSCIK